MFQNGELLNDTYQIIGEIGEGGAGLIYLAYHVRLKQKVVIKKIKEKYVERINVRKEADILKQLKHAYLPKVYDFFQMDDAVYTVIDYIEGKDLSYYISNGIWFKEEQLITWLQQLCEVLQYLHTRPEPIIHCDIKPTNIMVQKDGNICLIDFNISIGSYSGEQISGLSRHYSSPEQLQKSMLYRQGANYKTIQLDARTDIYSLGASFYHMITGTFPELKSGGVTPLQKKKIPYSKRFLYILDKAMQIDPVDRFQTAEEMLRAVSLIRADERELKRTRTARNVSYVVGLFFVAAGAVSIVFGLKEKNKEQFLAEYQSIIESKDDSEIQDRLVDQCLGLLNDQKYTEVLKAEKKEKADLLYIVADQCFKDENYGEAVSFYEEAIICNNENTEYYRDYAIALARNGELEKAQVQLDIAAANNLRQDDIYLVQAEIYMAQSDIDQAIQSFLRVLDSATDPYLISRASILCARAYRQQEQYSEAAEVLKKAEAKAGEQNLSGIWRELGGTCLEYLQKKPMADDLMQWVNTAIFCYQSLIDNHAGTFENYMNIAILKEYGKDNNGAMEQLKKMEAIFPDDYRVSMRQALLEMVIQESRSQSVRDYSQAEGYYLKAEELYKKSKNNGESDENMQLLEMKIKELHDKNWLD